MTWSIAARDPQTGAFGVVVSTKFFGVGSLCPFVQSGVGAIATQAFVNPTFGPRGLRLLREGVPAAKVLEILIASDEGREHRQLHLIDSTGANAAHTGSQCVDWCGHKLGPGFSVAGNMLAGAQVVEETFRAYAANLDKPLAERFLLAMEAGQAAGGDKRGRQSAAMVIYSTEEYPDLDIRVDDHPDPVVELRRLYEESKREYQPFKQFLPTRARPAGIYDRDLVGKIIEEQKKNDAMKAGG